MTASPSPVGKLPGYALDAPREADAVAALERVFGAQRGRAMWAESCGRAGVHVDEALSPELLERVLESLTARGGAAATVARSITIRMRTYAQLAARTHGSPLMSAASNTPARDRCTTRRASRRSPSSGCFPATWIRCSTTSPTRAAAAMQLPVSLVSVVLDEALHVAASHGIDGMWLDEAGGHPVEWSFCATSVRTREAFVVESATTHPDHRTNPLVTQDGVRCYAGVPLVSSRGFVLGNLCVVGMEERTFSAEEMGTLRTLAAEAVARIEQRRTGEQ